MRPLLAIALLFFTITTLRAQDVPPRFDVIYNAEFYRQDSPLEALKSALSAFSRDRYDYVLAHLMDPAYVDARLASTQTYFERVAAEQIGSTNAGKALNAAEFQGRTRELAMRMNIKQLAEQLRQKLADEPDNLKDLKRFAREAQFQEAGDTATASMKDVKDKTVYFKKAGGRWFLENKKEEKVPAKE